MKAFFVGGAAVGDVSLLSKILAALTTGRWYILLPPLQLKITTLLSDCNTANLSLICQTATYTLNVDAE